MTVRIPHNLNLSRSPCFLLLIRVKQSLYRPGEAWGFHEVEAPRFQGNRHMKLVSSPALRTGRIYPPSPYRKYSCYSFLSEDESSPGSQCGRKENVNKKFRDLLACSTVPQPTALPRAPSCC